MEIQSGFSDKNMVQEGVRNLGCGDKNKMVLMNVKMK